MTALFRLFILFGLIFPAATPAMAGEQQEIPYREDSGLTKAEYLLSVGQYSAAIDTANDVLVRHPDNADAYAYRGYAYSRLGESADAAKNFKKALELRPTHLGANKYLADIYLESGDVSRALEQLQVIRMSCGHTDCEELRALELEIDRARHGEFPKAADKENKKEEERKD
jgi:tetratricopeptide (TPR) repeat protein